MNNLAIRIEGRHRLPQQVLNGLRVLIVEDEFLIAMDAEQVCRDHGARDTLIVGNAADLDADMFAGEGFDAAIIDVVVEGAPTMALARSLFSRRIPFVFATGYSDREDVFREFPGVRVVGKPYSGSELAQAVADAVRAAKSLRGV